IILTANDNVYLVSSTQKAVLRSTAVYGDRYSMLNKYIEILFLRRRKIYMGILAHTSLFNLRREYYDIFGVRWNRDKFLLN
ncbi:MAG TPA: hypothetical protein PLG47_02775, partial [Candidatus Dojkabacteria bacterium]|nr:hypothetical protein [Candidatus Dojkabacteria bacterium]